MGTVDEFIGALENRFGEGLWRKIMVLPAGAMHEGGPLKRKKPFGEDSSLAREVVINDPIGHAEWNNYSLYLKYARGLFCIDFDTKSFREGGAEFVQMLRDEGTYHTETAKGFHFYVIIKDVPPFKNEVNLANPTHFNRPFDVDLLKKHNVWEIVDREVVGYQFKEFAWEEIKEYFNESKMNFEVPVMAEAGQQAPETVQAVVVDEDIIGDIPTCSEEDMKGLLDRLHEKRKNDYGDWLKVGMSIFTNFYECSPRDLETGWMMFDDWSVGGAEYDRRENMKRWKTFGLNRPEIPLTFRTISKMADEDNSLNIYETLYTKEGTRNMVQYINEQYIFNRQTSQIIYLDNGRHFIKKPDDMVKDLKFYTFLIDVGTGGKPKLVKVSPGAVWSESTHARQVAAIDFDPAEKRKDIYNLWQGYNIQAHHTVEADLTLCQPLLDHLLNVWCAGNPIHYTYLLNWFAWLLQRPERKVGTCVSIKSRQGGGKGTVLDMVRYIMDGDRGTEYYMQQSSLDHLVGANGFTSGMEGKMLINLDEAFWGGNREAEQQMKGLITEEHQKIHHKNMKPYTIKSSTAFIITTNNERFAGISKDDRRYFCLDCDDSHLDTKSKAELSEYFSAIQGRKYGKAMNHEVCVSFARVLYDIDLEGFNAQDFPKTQLAFNQIQQNWDSITRFWFQVLNTGIFKTVRNPQWGDEVYRIDETESLPDESAGIIEDGEAKWHKEWLYETYRTTNLGGFNSTTKEHAPQFWKLTKVILGPAFVERRIHQEGKRVRVATFGPLETLQIHFKKEQRAEGMVIFDEDEEA